MKAQLQYLSGLVLKCRALRWLELVFVALGLALFVFFLTRNWIWGLFFFMLTIIILGVIKKPWQYSVKQLCSTLDVQLPALENSSELLLQQSNQLSLIAKLQQQKVAAQLEVQKHNITLEHQLGIFALVGLLMAGLGFGLYSAGVTIDFTPVVNKIPMENSISFVPMDSVQTKNQVPTLISQSVRIRYPKYTKMASKVATDMNVQVLEGTSVTWQLQFDMPVDSVWLQFDGNDFLMKKNPLGYSVTLKVQSSSVYNFKFQDINGQRYLSEVYALQMMLDAPPEITIPELQQFSSFEYREPSVLNFTANMTDDFGIADAAIVATVSKGSGESVKFREERLAFDNRLSVGDRAASLKKRIDLKKLKMEVGDELYFYVEAKDAKTPKPNIARSETYFAVIKDTVTDMFAAESTMAADLMPDYFRSQRQLILDTEKLIKQRRKIKEQDFNFTSNELGFDQKALRLKYGQFMGDETEMFGASEGAQAVASADDPLASYTHDHDGDNEHHLVEEEHDHDDHDHDHGDAIGQPQEEDPLEAYVHNHSDPEASTLFAKSLKAMLKEAMAEMWDAELYLRLYQPEKSLPYQYKALKLIQEIKNSARIYVHRIGFDPPPIKETKRLTGDLDEITNVRRISQTDVKDNLRHVKEGLQQLDEVLKTDTVSKENQELFLHAGNELARLAIAQPGQYLQALQYLQLLAQAEDISGVDFKVLRQQLYQAIPDKSLAPKQRTSFANELDQLFLKQLTTDGE